MDWVRQTGPTDRLRPFLWGAGERSVSVAVLVVAIDVAHFAFHTGSQHPLRDLRRARVRALFRRHPHSAGLPSRHARRAAGPLGRGRLPHF